MIEIKMEMEIKRSLQILIKGNWDNLTKRRKEEKFKIRERNKDREGKKVEACKNL